MFSKSQKFIILSGCKFYLYIGLVIAGGTFVFFACLFNFLPIFKRVKYNPTTISTNKTSNAGTF